MAGVAIAVVVGLVLAGLTLTGHFPGAGAGSGSASPFALARADATSRLSGYLGATWSLAWAVGMAPAAPVTAPLNDTVFPVAGLSCSYASTNANSSSIGAIADVGSGNAGAWTFVFRNATAGDVVVSVRDGTAQPVGRLTGAACPLGYPGFGPVPLNPIDPTQAAATANSAGGAAFRSDYPGTNVTLLLLNPVAPLSLPAQWPPGGKDGSTGAVWLVVESTCPTATSQVTNGTSFEATVNATTGVLRDSGIWTGGCPRLGSVLEEDALQVLAVTAAFEASAGGVYWYNFSIRSVTGPVRFTDLRPSVERPDGSTVGLLGMTLEVDGPGGGAIATFDLASQVWSSGGDLTLAGGDTLVVSGPTSLSGQGLTLVLTGVGFLTGAATAPIP